MCAPALLPKCLFEFIFNNMLDEILALPLNIFFNCIYAHTEDLSNSWDNLQHLCFVLVYKTHKHMKCFYFYLQFVYLEERDKYLLTDWNIY